MAAEQEEGSAALRELGRGARVVSALVAVLVTGATAWYVVAPRSVDVVAPQCAGGDDCVISVGAPVDGVVVVALLVLLSLFALMAVTGVALTPSFGKDTGLTPMPAATEVEGIPKNVPQVRRPSLGAYGAARGNGAPPSEEPPKADDTQVTDALNLWAQLPLDMQAKAIEFAAEKWNVTAADLQLALVEVAHDPGKGNKPYYLKIRLDGGEKVMKLAKGGRGKTGVTAKHA